MGQETVLSALLERRSIRAFKPIPVEQDIVDQLELAAQRAPSSEFLNDWSAIRVENPQKKAELARIGNQPYIAQAPLLYVFVLDQYRNARIAEAQGVAVDTDDYTLRASYRFVQAQNDAVLALHAMETAADALGLGSVVLGSILNDVPALISLLELPKYTFPVLGIALGYPNQEPTLKPRMQRSLQFFNNSYDTVAASNKQALADFDQEVHTYYDLRQADRPVDAYSMQVADKATTKAPLTKPLIKQAAAQGFTLDK